MKKGRRPRRRPRLKLSDKAGTDQCPVPGENALFPAQIAGFLAVSRPVPVYPVFLNYVVPVHTLIRPVPVGRSLTLGGTTDVTCNSLNVTVQSPTGQTFTANSSGRSVGKSVTLTSAGLYTITVTAQKAASSTPVVYVYTVRAY